ncbi:fatty acid/retinol binding protein [Aphelenchoides avenae]|nr:fatty acid/retinol binding protein [Aphelenchus avenae]
MNLDNLPPIFQGVVPNAIKQFHASLNPMEKQALKAAHLRHEYHKDVLAELKQTQPSLYYKAHQLSVGFNMLMKNLQPEAGKYVQYVFLDFNRLIEKGRRPSEMELRTAARDYINRYSMLSIPARRAVQRALPEVASYMESN